MTAPDLSGVDTPAAFMEALRDYRALRGKPGYRLMAERCHQERTASTLREALAADALPNLATLRAILDGLQASMSDREAFTEEWQRLGALAAGPAGRTRP